MFIAQPLRRLFLTLVLLAAICFGQPFGTWKLKAAQSTFAGDIRPKSLTVRIEPRARGEVVTVYRTEISGQTSTCSMVLYLDGTARGFQQGECSGTQSSRRIDSQTIEVLRNCGPDDRTRFVRRRAPKDQLVLEISEERADGRRFGRRLIFEKQ